MHTMVFFLVLRRLGTPPDCPRSLSRMLKDTTKKHPTDCHVIAFFETPTTRCLRLQAAHRG